MIKTVPCSGNLSSPIEFNGYFLQYESRACLDSDPLPRLIFSTDGGVEWKSLGIIDYEPDENAAEAMCGYWEECPFEGYEVYFKSFDKDKVIFEVIEESSTSHQTTSIGLDSGIVGLIFVVVLVVVLRRRKKRPKEVPSPSKPSPSKPEQTIDKPKPEEKPTKDLIREAVEKIGGIVSIDNVVRHISSKYPGINKDTISTAMSDLAVNGPPSSLYKDSEKFLFRVERGKYRFYDPESDGVWEGGKKVIEPEPTAPQVTVELDFPEDLAYVGKEARVYARVKNEMGGPIKDTVLSATFPDALNAAGEELKIGFLAPQNVIQEFWTIQPKRPGRFTVYKPVLTYKDETGDEQKQELESIDVEVKEAPKEKAKALKAVKRSSKALFSPWCAKCDKYKGRQAECPHCGAKEE